MRIALCGADERYTYLAGLLEEAVARAMIVERAEDMAGADGFIGAYPFTETVAAGINSMRAGAKLWLLAPNGVPDTLNKRFDVCNLLDDAVFVNENAILTAEAAISAAMARAKFALSGTRVMVIGYGRIGRALTEFLVGLRACVLVVSRREQGRLQAMARGAYSASPERMTGELFDQRVVFVTSPERVLGDAELAYASKRTLIYDLSSAPHGVDADSARARGLSVFTEGGLPGRYCPESASQAIFRAVSRKLNGRECT